MLLQGRSEPDGSSPKALGSRAHFHPYISDNRIVDTVTASYAVTVSGWATVEMRPACPGATRGAATMWVRTPLDDPIRLVKQAATFAYLHRCSGNRGRIPG